MRGGLLAVLVWGALNTSLMAQASFVNWESPQIHPLDLTPDGTRLLAVNTADNRLEVFAVAPGGLTHLGAVPVGLDPVSVRARSDTEAWVVNHISDSISIVDLAALNVVRTLVVGDEPTDVVFAGRPERAFVALSQLTHVRVYDPLDPEAVPTIVDIAGEDLRALATDGTFVYGAIFESGNNTTILRQTTVSSAISPYPGHPNPPPNSGTAFNPPLAPGLPPAPLVGLIVKNTGGTWLDDNGADWSAAVTWGLHDHDVAVIDVDTLAVSYVTGLMNANMSLAVDSTGQVTVVGTDAINHVRFEPNVRGIFVRVMGARFSAGGLGVAGITDLNPHLDYTVPTLPQGQRDLSIGDPRGITWDAADRGYITGMGSNNLLVVDAALNRLGLVAVGQGPTGVVADPALRVVYVLNRFEGTISRVDTAAGVEIDRVAFYDPTPPVIKAGRPHLYDTHATSGLGQASCGSCHIDGRMDQLAWDLGDPSGAVQIFDQPCNFDLPGGELCDDWHPMKGPMATQTLLGISTTEPFHWRGDRADLAAFNGAFESLMGDDAQLSEVEMAEFLGFITTLTVPPNPCRNLDGSLPSTFPNGGNPASGETLFLTVGFDAFTCNDCHTLPRGFSNIVQSTEFTGQLQNFKVPQLRNLYEKTGFDHGSMNNNRGFGYLHDGSVPTVFDFLSSLSFVFSNNQQRRDVEAFVMCLSTDTHAAVGAQTTVVEAATAAPAQVDLLAAMRALADDGQVGLVVKGVRQGLSRGYAYVGGDLYQSDRAAETASHAALFAAAAVGEELTFTLVPSGSEWRIGIDRDLDGFFDRDELDGGSDPADPDQVPRDPCAAADLDGSGGVDAADLALLLGAWGPSPDHPADLDGDTDVGAADLALLLGNWGPC